MTDEELDALESALVKLADDMERYATADWDEHENVRGGVSAIHALRAQLAEARKISEELQAAVAIAEGYTHRAEAALAAQIGADAGILEAVADNWDCGHSEGRYCRCAELAEQWGIAADEIRTQPHDRTALDKALAEAEARGYQLASDEAKRSGWHLRRYDLAKRDAELATP